MALVVPSARLTDSFLLAIMPFLSFFVFCQNLLYNHRLNNFYVCVSAQFRFQAAPVQGETVVSRTAELDQFADSLRAWQACNYGYKKIKTMLLSELRVSCPVQPLRTWLANHPLDAGPAEVLWCLCVNIHIYTYIRNIYKYIYI